MFVGRLVEKKGCAYLLRAMRSVQQSFPAARLVVIGDGPERSSLEREAAEYKLSCDFLGAQSAEKIRTQLARARVFCVPSTKAQTGDSEGLGIVFAEAQAVGVPVVSTAHGGIPEVVCHGKTGLLAPEKDSEALAHHIQRFFADDIFWENCSKQAIRWIADKFDIRRQTTELELIYKGVIQRGVTS